ncbi:hypothetical protein [Zavarzinia sp. CC-PAN008]|uniref:hypothetical protein n=1 Tax=Zavarzinia sp. CC-PAN008 TaxID=3243332 RepID=UPI003F74381C
MIAFVERAIAFGHEADFSGRSGALCTRQVVNGVARTSWRHVQDIGQAAAALHAAHPALQVSAVLENSDKDDRVAAWAGTAGPLAAWLAAA